MDNSLYILLSKELGLFQQIDVITDNIANSETVGFKNRNMIFTEHQTKENSKNSLSFSIDRATTFDMSSGAIQVTNKPLDCAINGHGFFKVLTPLGEAYTRAGNFSLNQNGELVTSSGYAVLNAGGSSVVFEGDIKNIQINKKGTIILNNTEFDQLSITNFQNDQLLIPIGSSLFTIGLATISEDLNYEIIQGAVEKSNANKVKSLSQSIEAQRNIGSIVNLINTINNSEKSLIKNLLKTE